MDSETFRRLGHEWIDWIADYRSRIESLPVMSKAQPGDIKSMFPKSPPEQGGSMASAQELIESRVLPGITHWNHPSFFAYFPSNTSFASILGDLVAAGLGAQGMSWQTSPAVTEIEEVVLDWLRQMVGLPESFTGVIQDTASTATLTALLCARERKSEFAQSRGGLQSGEAPMTVYASEAAHSSIKKGTLLAGFGADNLRVISVDDRFACDLGALERAIVEDTARGLRPCAVVATVGTTSSTAMDPVAGIAKIARQYGLWLHVDAAMAGSAMILPENRHLWAGVEHADSVVFNPHKWMGTGFDLSAYYVRDPQHLVRVMATNPSYLLTSQDGTVKNFRDWHIQLGRRFRAIKLWFLLLDQGVDGLRDKIRRDLEHAQWLKGRVDASADWELVAPVPLQTVCIRHVPKALTDAALVDAHNLRIADRINQSGGAYVTPDLIGGKRVIRVSIGAETTELRHVERLWASLQSIGAELVADSRSC